MKTHTATPVTILTKAKEILETKGWCQGSYAKTSDGAACTAREPDAVCFCAVGAILRAGGAIFQCTASAATTKAIYCMEQAVGTQTVSCWNDDPTRTKEQVLAMFEKAITCCDVR